MYPMDVPTPKAPTFPPLGLTPGDVKKKRMEGGISNTEPEGQRTPMNDAELVMHLLMHKGQLPTSKEKRRSAEVE